MKKFASLEEKKLTSEKKFDGNLLKVYSDQVQLPDGSKSQREYINLLGAVAIVAVTNDNKIIIEKQYRYPLKRVITEIPAGKIDNIDEEPISAAKRELAEETGYQAKIWRDLGIYQPSPAYCNEKIYLFLAQDLEKGNQSLDDGEFLNVEELPIDELLEEIMNGNILDGKTQVGILKASRLLV